MNYLSTYQSTGHSSQLAI